MIRRFILLLPVLLLAAEDRLAKLAGRWRTRYSTFKSGRRTSTPARIACDASGATVIEEYALGGSLALVYRGTIRPSGDELLFQVSAVTEATGDPAPEGRGRYAAGQTYNLGAMEILSSARIRVGAQEWQRELD